MAQVVTGIVGGVVGFFVAGPYGAAIGFSVGSSLGAMFGSGTTVAGNTLGDIATQTAKEGVARPIIWGRVRPVAGNLIACSDPKIVKKKTKSGKGGGGTSTTTESVYRTYAIRVCEGPITRYTRIWRNNELVYDGRIINSGAGTASAATTPTLADGIVNVSDSTTTDWGNENNAEFLKNGRLYLGSWDQMPDSALEGIFGAGNVPAHRGTAYMVMDNELLNDTGGAVPQWTFEVERMEGVYLTSTPYAIETKDDLNYHNPDYVRTDPTGIFTESVLMGNASLEGGELKSIFIQYQDWPAESLTISQASLQSGELKSVVIQYQDWPAESLTISQASLQSGELKSVVIQYPNWPAESLTISQASLEGGTLS